MGRAEAPYLTGFILYRGDWRRYYRATFRGGIEIRSAFDDREVVSCRNSRYSGCSLREIFHIYPTARQIQEFASGGVLQIKLSAQSSSNEPIIEIPVSYFEAVRAVSKN